MSSVQQKVGSPPVGHESAAEVPTSSAPSEERAGSIELDREEETDKHREVEGGVLPGAKPPVIKNNVNNDVDDDKELVEKDDKVDNKTDSNLDEGAEATNPARKNFEDTCEAMEVNRGKNMTEKKKLDSNDYIVELNLDNKVRPEEFGFLLSC